MLQTRGISVESLKDYPTTPKFFTQGNVVAATAHKATYSQRPQVYAKVIETSTPVPSIGWGMVDSIGIH